MSQQITEEMVGSDAKSESLQKEYQKKWDVPWATVKKAIDQGYVYPGWKLIDYIIATDKGNPNLPKNPHDPTKTRKPFEYVDVWGVQGASKSNFCLQLMAHAYGKPYHPDWKTAVDRMLLSREMLIKAYEEVPNPNQRIPIVTLDDLNTIIAKQEWFVDKEFYILFHQFLNTIRTKVGTLMSTIPNVEFTMDALGDVVTFEVIIYPNSTYKVQRYCWDIHPWEPLKAKFTKIVVEESKFDIYKVPPEVWSEYQERRLQIANILFEKMNDHMESGGKKGEQERRRIQTEARKAFVELQPALVGDRLRSKGYKIDENKLQLVLAEAKSILKERPN